MYNTSTFSDMTPFALKRMWISDSFDVVRRAYDSEVAALKEFKHCQNIIKIIDCQEYKKKDGYEVFLLLEYCPHGTLFELIEEKCKIGLPGISDERELYKIINDVSNGLR